MKKLNHLFTILILFLTFTSFSLADTVLNVSSSKTTDAIIRTGGANFYGIWLTLDGVNNVTVSVYDGTTAAGTLLFPTTTITAADALNNSSGCYFPNPIKCKTGIFVDITTAGTVTYQVYYNTNIN